MDSLQGARPYIQNKEIFSTDNLQQEFLDWKNQQKKIENSPIVNELNGVKIIQKVCVNCKHTRFTFMYFQYLTLSVKHNSSPPENINDLIEASFKPSFIDDYKCEKCGKKTRLQTQPYIWKYPKLMYVFFNRFSWDEIGQKKHGAVTMNGKSQISLADFFVDKKGTNTIYLKYFNFTFR